MDLYRAHIALSDRKSSALLDMAKRLTKLFVGACVVLSLMLLQLQICPSASTASASETSLMVICTDDGTFVVEASGDKGDHGAGCSRCPDCLTCSSTSFDEPHRASILIPSNFSALVSMPIYESLHIGLPDHLLPFSGAPPPEKLDQTMLHTLYVPVRFASSKARRMPEVISWH